MSDATKAASESQDEYFLDTPVLRTFIEEVRSTISAHTAVDEHGAARLDVAVVLDDLRATLCRVIGRPKLAVR